MLFFLITMWVVYAAMTVGLLLYKNFQNNQVLGVTLSARHAEDPRVRALQQDFTRACLWVLGAFMALSLPVMHRALLAYAEFFLLGMMFANFFVNWLAVSRYQKKLAALKAENGWVYRRSRTVAVDLSVTREKGKAGISPVWTWLFVLLSFLPTAWLFLEPGRTDYFPLPLILIGPGTQLMMVYMFYKMRGIRAPVLSEDSRENLSCARETERVNSLAATLAGLSMLFFWISFCGIMFYRQNPLYIGVVTALLVGAMLLISVRQQRAVREIENRHLGPLSRDEEDIYETEPVWRWGFYYNPADRRVMVPKRVPSMGWTVNMAHPAGKAFAAGLMVLLLAVMGLLGYMGAGEYSHTESGSAWTVEAPMYKMQFDKSQVVSVELLDTLPRGTRTSGYGGAVRSYGRFTLDGYGKVMLYAYNDAGPYIAVQLEGVSPGWVIFNEKTAEETMTLYTRLLEWQKS